MVTDLIEHTGKNLLFYFRNLKNDPVPSDRTQCDDFGKLKMETNDLLDIDDCIALRAKAKAYTQNKEELCKKIWDKVQRQPQKV